MILPVSEILLREIEQNFSKDVGVRERIRIVADLEAFNYKEDEYVFHQKRDNLPQYFTVYFDNEYVCGFDARLGKDAAMLLFWKGLRDLYKEGKVRLNKWRADELRKEREAQEKAKKQAEKQRIDALPTDTKEQKMAKDIVRKLKNDKKTKAS